VDAAYRQEGCKEDAPRELIFFPQYEQLTGLLPVAKSSGPKMLDHARFAFCLMLLQ
jgi:hypothetical protein